MTKITLTDLDNLQNETTAVNAINKNNAILEVASDNTLSRDGTAPNQMLSTLDMNSNPIINLPAAGSDTEPVRRAEYQLDIAALSSASALLPNSVSNTILADMPANTYKGRGSTSGDPQDISTTNLTRVFNVKDYGAIGNGVTNDVTAIQAAITACINAGRGTVYFPSGTYACATRTINLLNTYGINFQGASTGNNGGASSSIILFTGAADCLISLDGTEGINFDNLCFHYNNPAYGGNLIQVTQDLGSVNTSFTTFRNFSAGGVGIHSANGIFSINKSLNTSFERGFINNAGVGIIGASTAGPDFCNGVYLNGVWFDNYLSNAVLLGGQNWNFTNCIFEPNRGSGDCSQCLFINAIGVQGLNIFNCNFADASTGIWIVSGGPVQGGTIAGNFIQGGQYEINMNSWVGVNITGNYFNNGAAAGTGLISVNGTCTDITALGNFFNVTPSTLALFDGSTFPTGNSIFDNHDGLGIRLTGGKVIMSNLPTSAPATAGSLWNSSGTVHIV